MSFAIVTSQAIIPGSLKGFYGRKLFWCCWSTEKFRIKTMKTLKEYSYQSILPLKLAITSRNFYFHKASISWDRSLQTWWNNETLRIFSDGRRKNTKQLKSQRNTWNPYCLSLSRSIKCETFSKVTIIISDSKVVTLSAIMKAPFSIMKQTDRAHTASLSEDHNDEAKLSKKIVNSHFLEPSGIFFWKSGNIMEPFISPSEKILHCFLWGPRDENCNRNLSSFFHIHTFFCVAMRITRLPRYDTKLASHWKKRAPFHNRLETVFLLSPQKIIKFWSVFGKLIIKDIIRGWYNKEKDETKWIANQVSYRRSAFRVCNNIIFAG